MTSDYQRALDWLYALEAAKGMDFKLERVTLALQRLGNPQQRFASVHIAGTNGKGSVAAMSHAVLMAAGHRTGLYISPHLVRFTERIRVGAQEIIEDEVVELVAEIQRNVTSHGIELTFFEFVTVLAFVHFARRGVEVAVVEVGLGGRLDATNVIDPLVAVITTIGLDHTEFLGDSLASVAAEKGGIIKRRRPVVVGRVPPEAGAVLRAIAAAHAAPLAEAPRDYGLHPADGGWRFEGLGWRLPCLTIGLEGAHQRENAATALAALAHLRAQWPVDEGAVRTGLASVEWPGRFQRVAGKTLMVLDGAHNCEAMAVVVRELADILGERRLHVLFAVMRDKPWKAMVDMLGPLCTSVTVTQVFPPRGEAPERVCSAFRRYCMVDCVSDPIQACAQVRERARAQDVILVTGSLFLVGAVLPLFQPASATSRQTVDMLHP